MFTKTYQHLQGKEASIGVCLVFLLNFQSAPDYRNVQIISDQQQHVQYSHTHTQNEIQPSFLATNKHCSLYRK